MEVLAVAGIFELLAVLVMVLAGVLVRLEVRLLARWTGEVAAAVGFMTAATAATTTAAALQSLTIECGKKAEPALLTHDR